MASSGAVGDPSDSTVLADGATVVGARHRDIGRALQGWLPGPLQTLGLLVLAALLCRVIWLDAPNQSLIFDELYYVNAARTILAWPVPADQPYAASPAGIDPNQEHPPLGKLVIAGSMALFGDSPMGWRLPSVVAGLGSLLLIYGICRAAGGEAWLGVLGAALFAFDNLALVHSRIGTLDMLMTAALLLAAWFGLRRQPVFAGVACGLAGLFKVGGAYGLLALGLFELVDAALTWRRDGVVPWARTVWAIGGITAAFLVVWLGGLWILDQRFGVHAAPWDHIRFMLQYGLDLTRQQGPANSESAPWQWLINEVQMPYLRVETQVLIDGQLSETRPIIEFRGAMNPIVIGAAPLAFGYTLVQVWRKADRLAAWTLTWIAGTYLPFYPLALLAHRISYIFYFLPTLPAVTVGLAILLVRSGLPRAALWTYLLIVLVGFIGYFPFHQPISS